MANWWWKWIFLRQSQKWSSFWAEWTHPICPDWSTGSENQVSRRDHRTKALNTRCPWKRSCIPVLPQLARLATIVLTREQCGYICLRIQTIIVIFILQMSWMSCCRTTGRPFCRTLLMICEGACPQMPCSPPRVLYTARWCIEVLV